MIKIQSFLRAKKAKKDYTQLGEAMAIVESINQTAELDYPTIRILHQFGEAPYS